MTPQAKRTALLLTLLAVVAALVLFDRASGGGADAPADSSTRGEVYLSAASLLAETRAVAESKPAWDAASQDARRAWDARRALMIEAPSAEIAAARLRTMIEQMLLDEGLALTSSETLPAANALENGEIVVVGLALSFDARDAEPVYRVLDRVEHAPGATLTVDSVALRGPGRMGGAGLVSVTFRIRAMAHLTGGARG